MQGEVTRDGELPAVSRQLRAALWALAQGASTGLALWTLFARVDLGAYVAQNQLPPGARTWLLAVVGLGALVQLGLGCAVHAWSGLSAAEEFVWRRAPLACIGFLPFLAQERLWRDREFTFLSMTLGFALGLKLTLDVALRAGAFHWLGQLADRLGGHRFWPPAKLWVVGLSVSYGLYFASITTTSHYNFCTSAFDLGIEDNLVWGAAHGGPLFRSSPLGGGMMHGGFHQTYFAYVLAPFYLLHPRAETLLVIQAIFLGAAAIPLYLFAQRRIGELPSVVICCLYVLYAPLHGANLYDFHYQPFGVFFVFLVACLIETGRLRWLVPVVLLTLSVREDMGAMLGALGAYFALSGRQVKRGMVLAAVGAAYFVALKLVIMPKLFLRGESSFAFMFKDLVPQGEKGFAGVLKTTFGNPGYTLNTLLERDKLYYLLQLFVPLVLLPLRRSLALILFVPATIFTLLSTGYGALIMTTFQYTSYWTPMVFLATVLALEAVQAGPSGRLRQTAWLTAMLAGSLLCSNRLGVIFQKETARGAFDPVSLVSSPEDHRNHRDFSALAARIPGDAKVVAAEWLVSHLADRRDAYTLRFGVLDAEYLIFWLQPKLRSDEKPVLRKALLGRDAPFGVVEQRGMFVLAKRGYDRTKNADLRRRF